MYSFHISRLTQDPLIWFILPGVHKESAMAVYDLICGPWWPACVETQHYRDFFYNSKTLKQLVLFLPDFSIIQSLICFMSLDFVGIIRYSDEQGAVAFKSIVNYCEKHSENKKMIRIRMLVNNGRPCAYLFSAPVSRISLYQ